MVAIAIAQGFPGQEQGQRVQEQGRAEHQVSRHPLAKPADMRPSPQTAVGGDQRDHRRRHIRRHPRDSQGLFLEGRRQRPACQHELGLRRQPG